jgi:exonuclease SbcD
MIKFLHFADIHLGVENYGRIDARTGLHSRLNDFIRTLTTAIDIAMEEKVDFALFCGDAYKNNNPNPTHQREFARQIFRLSQAGIPTVLINGNHDNPLTFGRASSLDIFHTLQIANIYVVTEPTLLNLPTAKGNIQVIGLPWPTKNQYLEKEEYRESDLHSINKKIQKRLIKRITELIGQLDMQCPRILAGHLTVAEAVFSGSENYASLGNDPSLPLQFLRETPLNYIALGHIHRYQNLNAPHTPPIVYCGSMDRINFGEEQEEKGFCIGSIDKKGKVDYEFIPLPVRKMLTIEIKIEDNEDPTDEFVLMINEYDLKDAIVRINYEATEEQNNKINFKKIEEALQEAFLITGINRNIQKESLIRRSTLSEEMDLFSALKEYIQLQNWQSWEKDLFSFTKKLEQELYQIDIPPGKDER